MKNILLIIMVSYSLNIQAQTKIPFDTKNLDVEWELLGNNHAKTDKALSVLRLINKSNKAFPSTGWALYFSSGRTIDNTSLQPFGLKSELVNGDLFRLAPTPGFPGIKPGQKLDIRHLSEGSFVNFTDAPAGFYLVFEASPEQGYPVGSYTVKSAAPKPAIDPATVFQRNEAIGNNPGFQVQRVFPTPVKTEEKLGGITLHGKMTVSADPVFMDEGARLALEFKQLHWPADYTKLNYPLASAIRLAHSPAITHPEGYRLQTCGQGGIRIEASTPAGIFYGIQSLKTLMKPALWSGAKDISDAQIPCLDITDEPRFAYRGIHLDVARHFHSKATVLKLLDIMALYKLNHFHFHLTEDEGWRLEIPGLPELTDVGSRRGHTSDDRKWLQPSFASGPDATQGPASGHYTRQDFIEILRYATARHIEVIPEIETPGHARAAIKAMEARFRNLEKTDPAGARRYLLSEAADSSKYRSVQGYDDNVINVALPSVYVFLEKVVDELRTMYTEAKAPLRTVHIGGDEVPAGVWEKSPAARQLIEQDSTVNTTDDLWYYYMGRVNDLLKKRGLYLSGWEEVAMRKTRLDGAAKYIPNPDFVDDRFQAYVWNNVLGWGSEDLAYRLANAGYPVVLAPVTNLYFDLAYNSDFDEPGYYWGGFIDIDKPFGFAPFDYYKFAREDRQGKPVDPAIFTGKDRLTDYGKSNILGLQGQLWSENLTSPERLEYMAFPKLLGLAERAWAPAPAWETATDSLKTAEAYREDWSRFVHRLGRSELPRLDYYRGGVAYRIPVPGLLVKDGKVHANLQFPGFTLRYTTDGSEPDKNSAVYKEPLAIKGNIRIRAFDGRGRGGRSSIVEIK